MFRHADPTRRTPTYLQSRTVENLKWQLKLLPVLFVAIMLREKWEDRKFDREMQKHHELEMQRL